MSESETLQPLELTAAPSPEAHKDAAVNMPTVENAPEHLACANCSTPLLGPHCYACSQPEQGMVRHFGALFGDFFNTVFGLDSRIACTFGPLLLNPGFLSNEYIAGRRVRYVSPVRLFIFLCLTAFFVANLSSDWGSAITVNQSTTSDAMGGFDLTRVEHTIDNAASVDKVLQLRDEALAEIAEVSRDSGDVPGISELLTGLEQIVHRHANQRIATLDPAAAEQLTDMEQMEVQLPQIEGAPSAVSAWLERQSARLTLNMSRIEKDPNLLKDALFGAIPTALFIMLPIFAVCLSLLYVFKRRLYMEHLIVALHSHAFLSLALLLAVLLIDLRDWLTVANSMMQTLFDLALLALGLWVPVYLLLMQKRVYRQGWPMTALKYSVLGVAYIILLGIATAFAGLASVASF